MASLKELMLPKHDYFVDWQEYYDEQECSFEFIKYTKDDYEIVFIMTCDGWTVGLGVEKNGEELVDIEYGKCVLSKGFNKNNIKKLIREASKEWYDKKTGTYKYI